MSKRHANSMADISPTDPDHPWVPRGYRPDFAYSVRKAPVEDEYGEIAYQRAFFEAAVEAAEAKSRRVPDPVFYHNSPSALEYIKRRDHAIFSVKPRVVNNKSSSQPNTPSSTTTSNYSPGKLPSPYTIANTELAAGRAPLQAEFGPVVPITPSSLNNRGVQHVSPRPVRPPTEQFQPYSPHGIPLTLEPKLVAPSGPSRMLR